MRRLVFAAMAAATLSCQAMAADMQPIPGAGVYYTPKYTWSGFYFGGQGGGRRTGFSDSETGIVADVDGWIFGAVTGGNIQVGNVVVGLEGDYGIGEGKGSSTA